MINFWQFYGTHAQKEQRRAISSVKRLNQRYQPPETCDSTGEKNFSEETSDASRDLSRTQPVEWQLLKGKCSFVVNNRGFRIVSGFHCLKTSCSISVTNRSSVLGFVKSQIAFCKNRGLPQTADNLNSRIISTIALRIY